MNDHLKTLDAYVKYDLPQLISSRRQVQDIFQHLSVAPKLPYVVLDAKRLDSASQGSADEIIKRLMGEEQLLRLYVINASERFASHLEQAADLRSHADRLDIQTR